jgi:UPF0755 protein
MIGHRLLGILVMAVSATAAWFWYDYQTFSETPLQVPNGGISYHLESGTSMGRLSNDLERRGIIRSGVYLRSLASFSGRAGRIQAGEYFITPGTTPETLLQQLVSGRVTSYSLTLVEGWNFRQVLTAVHKHEALKRTLEGLPDAQTMARLGHADEHPEGRFYPDTYRFPRGTTDVAFLKRAYQTMSNTLSEEWAKREPNLPLQTAYEALILASIVEKETGVTGERGEIAGVFLRRLRKGMKLQTDPTVIYGMGESFEGNIRRRDLKQDTPYNTYVHAGLPPTPISMPGVAAIRAVLNPAQGNSLYFVARGDGSHQFSATLVEHNRAVRKFQLKKR